MTLRNVPNSFTLEQQRLEINELAVDLDTAVDGNQTFSGDKEFVDSVVFNTGARFDDNAAIDFGTSVDASLKYDTTSSSLRLFANNTDLNLFADNFNFYTSVSNSSLKIFDSAAVELYYNNLKKFETTNTGVTITGNISIGDGDQVLFGASNDMTLYHSGLAGFLENGTGDLYLRSGVGSAIHIEPAAGADSIVANAGGSVALYHNGLLKAETATSGLRVDNYLYSAGNLTIVSGGTILSRSHMVLPNSTSSAFEINGSTSGTGGITIDSGGGTVRLQHSGNTKLSTNSTGVSISGTISATEFSGPVTGNADTATALETARNIAGQSFDGTADITIAATDLSDTDQALATTSDVTFNTITKSGGLATEFLKADGSVDSTTYLSSYTETDPVVGAITGIVKADGAGNISAAVAGTDYAEAAAQSGEITLGATPTWTGTAGVTVTQQSSGNYRMTFTNAFTNATDYYVFTNHMDYIGAQKVFVTTARSNTHVDFTVYREGDGAFVDTGSIAIQVIAH